MEQLRQTYNTVINDADAFNGDPRQSLMRRVRRGEIPAILSTDSSASSDIWGFFLKAPNNTFNAFYNPRRVNVDDMGRLSEKAFRKFYRPTVSLIRWTAWMRPNMREEGVKNLRAMDLDSFSYMEPILHYSDTLTLQNIEPLFFGSEAYHGDENADDESHHSPCARIISDAQKLKDLAEKITNGQISVTTLQQNYNEIIHNFYEQQNAVRDAMQAMQTNLDRALADLDAIKISSKDGALKRERIKAMHAHFMRLQKQGVDLFNHIEHARGKLEALGNGHDLPSSQFAEKLKALASDLEHSVKATRKNTEDLANMAHARLTRKVRIKDKHGKYVGDRNAKAEEYRRLKLGLDLLFVPEESQTLGMIKPTDKEANAESYFVKMVEHGMKGAFDDEGKHIPIAQRGATYGKDLTEFATKLYALSKPEDALYAIKLLKMAEGKENYQMFPSGFQDMVKQQMAAFYGVSTEAIENSAHAKLFLERVREFCSTDDHSPLIYGPRDTSKRYYNRVRRYIYGRMYPGSDSFIAVPLHMDVVQKPLIKARSGLFAYLTGGQLAPISEAGRAPKSGSVLEEEAKLYIQRNWLWKKPTEEEAKNDLDENGNKKKRFFLTRLRRFYKRAPLWVKTPTRLSQIAAISASVIIISGGLTVIPAIAIVPIHTLAAMGALNYGSKALRHAWKMPFVNKSVKFAAKWGAISAAVAGTGFAVAALSTAGIITIPSLTVLGTLITSAAAAHPIATTLIAAPFALTALSAANKLSKGQSGTQPKNMTFADLRQSENIDSDPLKLMDEHGAFMPSKTPEPVAIVLELSEPIQIDTTRRTERTRDDDMINAFMERMEERDQAFMDRMEEIFRERQNTQNHSATDEDDEEDIIDVEIAEAEDQKLLGQ